MDGNALGGGHTKQEDPRLKAMFDAVVEHLQNHPEVHGAEFAPGDSVAGFLLIPIITRHTPEGDLSNSGLMHFVADGERMTVQAMASAISEAGLRWYGFVNGDRINILDAYVAGDIEAGELEGLLNETLDRCRQALGLPFLPLDRGTLAGLLASIRAKLAE